MSVEEGVAAGGGCALNALGVLEAELGTLDRIARVLTVTGYVASAPDFHEQPAVVDGASRILHQVFGDVGRHSRSAIGVAALPEAARSRSRSPLLCAVSERSLAPTAASMHRAISVMICENLKTIGRGDRP